MKDIVCRQNDIASSDGEKLEDNIYSHVNHII